MTDFNTYDPGDSVKVTFTVSDSTGTLADPTTLNLRYYNVATGAWVTKVYGTDSEVVKSSTGTYYIIVYVPNARASRGRWHYEGDALDASGNSLTVSPGHFDVRSSARLG